MTQIPVPIPKFTRRYEPIWHQLKTTGKCKVSIHKVFHARLKKAVLKEKNEDLGFKLELSEKGQRARLKVVQTTNILEFILIKSIGVEDL